MKYRNTKTGAVIQTVSVVSGGDWVEVVETPKPKRTRKAKGRDGK